MGIDFALVCLFFYTWKTMNHRLLVIYMILWIAAISLFVAMAINPNIITKISGEELDDNDKMGARVVLPFIAVVFTYMEYCMYVAFKTFKADYESLDSKKFEKMEN